MNPNQSLVEIVQIFLTAKSAQNTSQRTLRWYSDQLALLVAWCGEDVALADINSVDLIEWLDDERGKGLSPNTLDARWRAASAFFNWCEVFFEEHGFESPMGHGRRRKVQRPRRGRPLIDYVEQAEMRQLLDSIKGSDWRDCRDRAIVRVLYWSGLRLAECAALDAHDLRLRDGYVIVRHGKGDKARHVPIAPEVGPDVLGYLYSRPPWSGPELWLADGTDHHSIKGRFTPGGIRQMLRRRCERAKMRVISPHEFRHGFAMLFLNKGLGLSALSELMGHASVETTSRIYAHWLTEPLREQYEIVYEKATRHGK